jgi:precorrin-2/cobalt-factor-2 C20-methyltransferase
MSTTGNSTNFGRFYGVGVGPGDPELLTLKALRVLQEVPVICTPRSESSQESYALDIVRDYLDEKKQEIIRIPFPIDDEAGAAAVWRNAADTIGGHLKQGKDVAFITEGDPMLYSTFSYVLDSIKSGYPEVTVEIIPGVSSVMAAAASAGVPLVPRPEIGDPARRLRDRRPIRSHRQLRHHHPHEG